MNLLEALLLGVIQGATEFLPVSSSGHSLLAPDLLGLDPPGLTAIAIAHLGTLLAVLLYFRQELWAIAKALVAGLGDRRRWQEAEGRLGWLIIAGSVPVAIAGLLLEDFFSDLFEKPVYAAAFLLVTAALLVAGERLLSGDKPVTGLRLTDALLIGLFQTFALFPGVSRSGSTIVAGLLRGLDREAAARFGFLLSIPAVLGAGLLELLKLAGSAVDGGALGLIVVFLAAAVTGYACIALLLGWLRGHSLYPFAVYCALFGLFYLALAFLGVV